MLPYCTPIRSERRLFAAWAATCALLASLLAVAWTAPAAGETLASASFQVVGSHLNGGGGVDLEAAAPGALVASAGVSIGQSPPLGSSPESSAGPWIHLPGFWPIAAISGGAGGIPGAVPAMSALGRWLLVGAFAVAALPVLRRRGESTEPEAGDRARPRGIFAARAGRAGRQ